MTTSDCPDCGAKIVACDNRVFLDYPAVPFDGGRAQWTLMRLGDSVIATAGDAGMGGLAHTLHEHQPSESVMA